MSEKAKSSSILKKGCLIAVAVFGGLFIILFVIFLFTADYDEINRQAEERKIERLKQKKKDAIKDSIRAVELAKERLIKEEARRAKERERLQAVKAEQRNEMINDLLHDSDGVLAKLRFLIKKDLNDPRSMETISFNHVDKDSLILVKYGFTAKNAFGGRIRNDVIVSVDSTGNILEINKWFE